MKKEVQIVAFDIPYPPNYGGVIDIYYKIKYLKQKGFDVILHAYDYKEKKDWGELPQLCKKIHSYKRKKGFFYFFHYLPYTVITRLNKELNNNLLSYGTPVVFEVLHTTGALLDRRIRNLQVYYRHSNVEHRYYFGLARDEKNLFKKLYYYAEALKFYFYEKNIRFVKAIYAVNENDADYYKKKYKVPVYYVPSFHPFNETKTKEGKGDYVLFHGNLTVNENIRVAEWILKHVVAELPEISFVFAGKEPSQGLIWKCMQYANVTVESNPSDIEMENFISNAHINLVLSFNPEGLKLKMLYSLFSGRFVLISRGLLPIEQDIIHAGIYVVNASDTLALLIKIKHLIHECFTRDLISGRREFVKRWSNENSIRILTEGMGFKVED